MAQTGKNIRETIIKVFATILPLIDMETLTPEMAK
jgi:hypothetical protein